MIPSTHYRDIPLADIHIPKKRDWELDEKHAQALAESIKVTGLTNPLAVAYDEKAHKFTLIAGRHRLRGCEIAGLDKARSVVFSTADVTDDQLRLIEIDENLMRRELDLALRAKLMKERAQIEARMAKGVHNGQPSDRGISAVARKTGRARTSVIRDVHRGEALTDDELDAIQGTTLSKGTELDALVKLKKQGRVDEVEEIIANVKQAQSQAPQAQAPKLTRPVTKLGTDHINVIHKGRDGRDVGIGIGAGQGRNVSEVTQSHRAVSSSTSAVKRVKEGPKLSGKAKRDAEIEKARADATRSISNLVGLKGLVTANLSNVNEKYVPELLRKRALEALKSLSEHVDQAIETLEGSGD